MGVAKVAGDSEGFACDKSGPVNNEDEIRRISILRDMDNPMCDSLTPDGEFALRYELVGANSGCSNFEAMRLVRRLGFGGYFWGC